MTIINVKGPIIRNGEKWIYDWFEEEATCPKDIIKALPEDGSEVKLMINSNGGYVDCGNEIYTALKSYTGHVTVDIIRAASAASVIAMAGNTVRIAPVGCIMIHNASCVKNGDYHDMDKASELLQKTNQSIANAYQIKTGLAQDVLLAMMDTETWMTAEEAKEKGFVDEILFLDCADPVLVASAANLLPEKIITKMHHMKQNNALHRVDGELEPDMEELVNRAVQKAVNNIMEMNGKQKKEMGTTNGFFIYD